jgi:hypothetical protein
MRYMKLDENSRHQLLQQLAAMETFLREAVRDLPDELLRTRSADGGFSPVEQVWHLADLEAEAFASRIERLLSEPSPQLPDFDGTAIARERCYRELSVTAGLDRFAAARTANIERLQRVTDDAWSRTGVQEGVGPVALCEMPVFLLQHDLAHVEEIAAWQREQLGRVTPSGHGQ